MLAVYRSVLSGLAGAVALWMWTIMRERHRAHDYLHGDYLAFGVILFCAGTIFGQVFAWYKDLPFSPGSLFAFAACFLFLGHMILVIRSHRDT